MKYFFSLLGACVISLLAYLFIFGFVVSRPLVVDQIHDFMDKKLAYASATPHPKLFLVAGSNARFSHSCAVLEQKLKRPCVNMGIAQDIALDWVLDSTRPQLASGDLVYLPIEYDIYLQPHVQLLTGMDAAYRFRHNKSSLATRGPEGLVRAAFMFSLPTLVQSIGEMGLQAAGVRRRFGLDTLDRQGDEIGHDGDARLPYVNVIRRTPQENSQMGSLPPATGTATTSLGDFLDWCRNHDVIAVGGLPTIFNDVPVSPETISALQAFYGRHGARFIVLANRSQYARSEFYDTAYHLRQSAQKHHSELLAEALRPLLPVHNSR